MSKKKMERKTFIDLAVARQKYINEDMDNPKYIFHGNHQLQDKIRPRKPPLNYTKDPHDTQVGIYGSIKINGAIPYSIKVDKEYADEYGEEFLNYFVPPKYKYEAAEIIFGQINPNSKGYVYVLDSKNFKKDNDYQWVAKVDEEPLDIIKVDYNEVKDHFIFPHLSGFEKTKDKH